MYIRRPLSIATIRLFYAGSASYTPHHWTEGSLEAGVHQTACTRAFWSHRSSRERPARDCRSADDQPSPRGHSLRCHHEGMQDELLPSTFRELHLLLWHYSGSQSKRYTKWICHQKTLYSTDLHDQLSPQHLSQSRLCTMHCRTARVCPACRLTCVCWSWSSAALTWLQPWTMQSLAGVRR